MTRFALFVPGVVLLFSASGHAEAPGVAASSAELPASPSPDGANAVPAAAGAPAASTPDEPPEPTGAPPPLVEAGPRRGDAQRPPPPPPMPQWSVDTPMMGEPPPPPPPPPDRDPILGLNLALGIALGGDELGSAEYDDGTRGSLGAGNGVVLSTGVTVTPLWFGGRFGLGIGGDLGWKYTSLSGRNGVLSLNRFPLVASLHGLLEVSPRWYVLASGGVQREVGIALEGRGIFADVQSRPEGRLGAMAEVGAFYARREIGADVTLRYTAATFELAGDTVDASSVGVFGAVHYNLY